MKYDIFFSISQTPVDGKLPSEVVMFENFFEQVKSADKLGYGVAWIAESHFSTQIQKGNKKPVVPHWQGEIGLNVDVCQLAHRVFAETTDIEVGSAIMNILCNGGPIAAAEKLAYFCALHGANPDEKRKLNIGFSAGRFDFMNRAYGIEARNEVEEAGWPVVKGKVFAEACEVFLRLLRGDVLSSEDIPEQNLTRDDFRSDEDWERVIEAYGDTVESLPLQKRFVFEKLKIIPQEWRRDLLQLIIGSHDPKQQVKVNEWMPVQVFNLSITQPEIIEETHDRMAKAYHQEGGAWCREHMPRTVFVFLNEEAELSTQERREGAHAEAKKALGAYWTALEGTLDPSKVERAANNALIGNADDVAHEIVKRFHPDDRLMLWFDFFNHDSKRVISNMERFMNVVVPKVRALLEKA